MILTPPRKWGTEFGVQAALPVVFLWFCAPLGLAHAGPHLEYKTFLALTALAPEVQIPRLVGGLTEAGHDLWARGQARIPAEPHFVEADLDRDGKMDAALLFRGGNKHYLLVAGRSGRRFERKALFTLEGQERLLLEEGMLKLEPPEAFLEWDSRRFRLDRGPLALYLHAYKEADFGGVQVKLTYIGPQTKPFPGLLLSSYYHWADLEAFRPHRRPGVHYGNDDLKQLWHLTLSAVELQGLVRAAARLDGMRPAAGRTGREKGLSHSFSILDTRSARRPNIFEALLTFEESGTLLKRWQRAWDRGRPSDAGLLKEYLKMFGK